ncbi:hypothetical protein PG995_010609 [Apiospora arundinis]
MSLQGCEEHVTFTSRIKGKRVGLDDAKDDGHVVAMDLYDAHLSGGMPQTGGHRKELRAASANNRETGKAAPSIALARSPSVIELGHSSSLSSKEEPSWERSILFIIFSPLVNPRQERWHPPHVPDTRFVDPMSTCLGERRRQVGQSDKHTSALARSSTSVIELGRTKLAVAGKRSLPSELYWCCSAISLIRARRQGNSKLAAGRTKENNLLRVPREHQLHASEHATVDVLDGGAELGHDPGLE